jgi:hypothetical protein
VGGSVGGFEHNTTVLPAFASAYIERCVLAAPELWTFSTWRVEGEPLHRAPLGHLNSVLYLLPVDRAGGERPVALLRARWGKTTLR